MRGLVLSIFATALVVGSLAASAPVAGAAARLSGNAAGVALFKRVERAYRAVPAAAVSGRLGSLSVSFVDLLRDRKVIAEDFTGMYSNGATTRLVARGKGPTYALEPGTTCWRVLSASDSQSLSDIGTVFPTPVRRVGSPRKTRTGWVLPVTAPGGRAVSIAIDRGSYLVRSLTYRTHNHRYVDHVSNFRVAPKLFSPSPRC